MEPRNAHRFISLGPLLVGALAGEPPLEEATDWGRVALTAERKVRALSKNARKRARRARRGR